MSDLDQKQQDARQEELAAIRKDRRYAATWSKELETEFRDAQRAIYRIPRATLFLVQAGAYASAPLLAASVFNIQPEARPALSLGFATVAIVLVIAALAVLLRTSRRLTSPLQVVATGLCGLAPIFLYFLSTRGVLDYAPLIATVAIQATMLFGSYGRFRTAIAGLFAFSALMTVAALYTPEATSAAHNYGMALTAIATILAVFVIEVIARLAWVNSQLLDLSARLDWLTGLGNRSEFNRHFETRLAQARRDGKPVSVFLFDLDHFKQINDRHGHPVGDQVLRAVGKMLRSGFCRRPSDLAIRLGGEEFLLLWYDATAEAASQLAGELLAALRALDLRAGSEGTPVPVTGSGGLLHIEPVFRGDAAAVFRRVDELLYRAKQEGRDRLVSDAL